jgi:hypothetical protein
MGKRKPVPKPPPLPPPPPPPTGPTLQSFVDAAGSVLDLTGLVFTAGAIVNRPLTIRGGLVNVTTGNALTIRAHDVTLDGVQTSGGQNGILANLVSGLTLRNCLVTDAVYGGLMLLSVTNSRVENNTIRRIGMGVANGTNAYGVLVSDYINEPVSADVVVTGNVIEDVPSWHGLDTHGGQRITFCGNTVRRCSRPVFVTWAYSTPPRQIAVIGNRLESPAPVTYNLVAVTMNETADCSVTGNLISSAWPVQGQNLDATDRIYDYLKASTGLVVSGNSLI